MSCVVTGSWSLWKSIGGGLGYWERAFGYCSTRDGESETYFPSALPIFPNSTSLNTLCILLQVIVILFELHGCRKKRTAIRASRWEEKHGINPLCQDPVVTAATSHVGYMKLLYLYLPPLALPTDLWGKVELPLFAHEEMEALGDEWLLPSRTVPELRLLILVQCFCREPGELSVLPPSPWVLARLQDVQFRVWKRWIPYLLDYSWSHIYSQDSVIC